MARILVTGVGGPAGYNAARILLEQNHVVAGTDIRELFLPSLIFYRVPAAADPAFVPELQTIAAQEQVALVIPTVSEELPVLARQRRYWGGVSIVIGAPRAIDVANDKYLTCIKLSRQGIAVPRFILPSSIHSAADVEEAVGWPCLSKPRVSRGGREVTIYQKEDWPLIQHLSDHYLLQEFIPGLEYTVDLYLLPAGPPVGVVLEKLERKEGLVGNAVRIERTQAPDVRELAVAAAGAIGIRGPVDMDIRRRKNGLPVVLEINARLGAHIYNVPEIMTALLRDFGVGL